MTDQDQGWTAERYRYLCDLLSKSQRVRRLAAANGGAGTEDIAAEAADALLDIERSARALVDKLVPQLLQSLNRDDADVDDTLTDIGEEYRHIYYHIRNTRLFDYVASDR